MIDISIILPTYNEKYNICTLIDSIQKHVPKEYKFEIINVDDNSPDGTHDLVKKTYKNNKSVITILRKTDRGFAKSIYTGILESRGKRVIIMDTDLTHDPKEIPNLVHLAAKYDIVSASRFCSGGRMSSKFHYIASFTYNLALRIILHTQIQDNLGGYFIAKKSDILSLNVNKIFYGYGDYFFRLLYALRCADKSIVEIPANYTQRSYGKSKSNWFKMFINYGTAALKFKYNLGN